MADRGAVAGPGVVVGLELKGLSRRVGGESWIDGIDLDLAPGQVHVLLGRTGAGKTTLLRLIGGLERPDCGRVLMDGEDVTGVTVRRREVAMVYQQFVNYPSMTVYDNIASPLRVARVPRDEIDRRVRTEARRLHIEHLLGRRPAELSGGQQQRTALARALVRDARLLLLDEPLVNLDYKLREELRAELRELLCERRAVVVYATTDPAEALGFGGQVAVLHAGRLLQYGPAARIYHAPASVEVAQVSSDPPMNLIDGILDEDLRLGSSLQLPIPGHLRGLEPGRYRFGIRPVHLSLVPAVEAPDVVRAEVRVAEVDGARTSTHVRHVDGDWVVRQDGVQALEVGSRIGVRIQPERLFAFAGDGRLRNAPLRSGVV